MIKNIGKLACLLLLVHGNTARAGVDCSDSPHTRLEIAICGEPVLHAIDQALTDALTRAQQRGVIDQPAARNQRNKIARQCRREVDETLNSCLHHAELQALEWVAVKLGESEAEDAVKKRHLRNRLREGLAHQKTLLQKQLLSAESRMRRTGNPDLTVETLFELIGLNNRQQQLQSNAGSGNAREARQVVARLEQRLVTGCSHPVYGNKWRRMIEQHDMSCDELQGKAPARYSSSDY